MSVELHKEVVSLRRNILSMGASVEDRVTEAIDSLLKHDIQEAREVRAGDDEIDAMDIDIEMECLRLLALTQPVAGDLRFILAVLRINNDLERIADLARSIAKRVIAMDSHRVPIDLPPQIEEMASKSKQMLSDALAALSNDDAALCDHVRRADDIVDALLKKVFAWAQEQIPLHVDAAPAILDVLSIARKLERIADIATNIAEDVIFITRGSIVRHTEA